MFTFDSEFVNNVKQSVRAIAEVFAYLTAASLMFSIIRGFLKVRFEQFFYNDKGKVDPKKFWNFVAYFCATIGFVYINFQTTDATRDWIWLIYLGVVSGDSLASKLLDYKLGTKKSQVDDALEISERNLKRGAAEEYDMELTRPIRRSRMEQYQEDEYDTVQIDYGDGMDEDERNERFYR